MWENVVQSAVEKNDVWNVDFYEDDYLITWKITKHYDEVQFQDGDFLVFGKETAGLPQKMHDRYADTRIKIPMLDNAAARSLNFVLSSMWENVVQSAVEKNDVWNEWNVDFYKDDYLITWKIADRKKGRRQTNGLSSVLFCTVSYNFVCLT